MCYNKICLNTNTMLSTMLTQLCYHLKRKTSFILTSYNVCISILDLKLENDHIFKFELQTRWDNYLFNQMAKNICGIGSAHHRATYIKVRSWLYTYIFERYVVRCGCEDEHQKIMCFKGEWTTSSKFVHILGPIVNYMFMAFSVTYTICKGPKLDAQRSQFIMSGTCQYGFIRQHK